MKQFDRKLWLKRSTIVGLSMAMCTSFVVGVTRLDPKDKLASAEEKGVVITEFTEAETTVSKPVAWGNGKHNNWVTPEDLTESFYYSLYNENNEYVDTKSGGKAMEFVEDPTDANDTVLKYWTGKSGVYLTQFAFAKTADMSNVAALTFRFYAHVDTDNASKIQIFPSEVQNTDEVDAFSTPYLEYQLTAQNQWMELTISGDDLAKIADDTFEGFVVRIQMSANAYPRDKRGGTDNDKHSGYILFDSVSMTEKVPKTTVSEFLETEMTVSQPTGWGNGKHNNWVTPEDLSTVQYYALYDENNAYVDTKSGKAMEFVEDPTDANDTVLKYWTGPSGIYLTQFTFENVVDMSNVAALTFRFYAHVDTDNASKIQIFPSEVQNTDEVDAFSTPYLEYQLAAQNQWLELTISGDDLAKIADDTFEGFVIRIQMSANAYPRDKRGGTDNDKHSGYILFDRVVATGKSNQEYTVTFDYDKEISGIETTTQRLTVDPYKATAPEIPAVFGKQFDGWFTEDNELFDFTKAVSSDITLKAKYSDYVLADKVLTDGSANSLQYGKRTLINSNSNGWTNDAVEDKRLSYDDKGLRMATATEAYYGYYAKTLKEIDVEDIDSLTFKFYIDALSTNANTIDIFAGDAEARYGEKLSFKYADYMTDVKGEVIIKLTQEQLATIAIDGKFSSFNLFVHATGYDGSVDGSKAYITIDEISYTVPEEVDDYSTIVGTYYGNDSKVLTLNADKTATYEGQNAVYVLYKSGALKVTVSETTYEGIFYNGSYSINSVTYYKYNNEQLQDNLLTDFAPWNVAVSENTFVLNDNNGWVNSFYDLKKDPTFVVSDDYTNKFAVKLFNGAISAVPVCKVMFKKTVSLEQVGSLTIRMYIHVGDAAASYMRVYASDEVARNSSNYCEVKFNVAQETGYGWYDFTIMGDDLAKIADANGNIAGLHVLLSLTDSATQAADAQVILDSISYKVARKVTFSIDGVNETVKVVNGEKVATPANPVKEGYYFVGWYNGTELYDFETAVDSDITLTAKFLKYISDYSAVMNSYTSSDNTILSLNENGVCYLISGNAVEKCEYALTEGDVLVVKTASGVYSFNKNSILLAGKEYNAVESVKVNYVVNGETATIRMPKDSKAPIFEIPAKDGYSISGWYNGDQAYDFQTALTEEITLTAKYEYIEISDYSAYLNTYYNAASNTMLIFMENNDVKCIVNGVETTLKYYVVDGTELDTWLIIKDGVETVVMDNTVAIAIDNVSYQKLKSYKVTFVNGQTREEVTVNSGYYKVEEPTEPTKLGYTFDGWFKAGETTAFDFDTVITENIELTAKWTAVKVDEPVIDEPADTSSLFSCTSTISGLSIGTIMLAALAVICKKGKEE